MLQPRTASFHSPLGERLLFYSMTGREELGVPFRYEVDLLSEDEAIDFAELLGHACTVALEHTDGSLREFSGFVTQFSLVGEHGRLVRYRALLEPWLWFLGQTRNSRVFQARTVPEVFREIFHEHGFSDFVEILSGKYRTWEYLVQYRESDLDFVSRLLEQEGIHYFFRHAQGKHELLLADSNDAHDTIQGYERVPYFERRERERREDEHIDTWHSSKQVRPTRVSLRDYQFATPEIIAKDRRESFDAALPELDVYDFPGEFSTAEEGELQARLRLEAFQHDYETVRGAGPVRGLKAGSRFSLTQFPRDDQNREYLVVSSSYDIRVAEYETKILADEQPSFRCQFLGIDAKRPFRAPRRTRKPRVRGVHTASVCGPEGAEIHTDPYGRVRVKFHWDRRPEANESSSCFIRVSQAWAGQEWGSLHVPRIGQEVLVDFLEGDPDRPIITGRVYNQAQMPPYKLPDHATQSGIKSRSSPNGSSNNFNELRFEDKKNEEEFHFQAEKDMSTLVKNDQSTTVRANRSASIAHDDSVSVKGDRSLGVGGNLAQTVAGGGKSPVHYTYNVTGKHALEASDTIEFEAPTHIQMSVGNGTIMITPAGIALAIAEAAAMALDANVAATSKGGSALLLDQNALFVANAKAAVLFDNNVLMGSASNTQLILDPDAKLGTLGKITLDGKTVAGTGKDEASFAVAASSMTCGGDATLLAAGMINVTGMGMVSIMGTSVKVN